MLPLEPVPLESPTEWSVNGWAPRLPGLCCCGDVTYQSPPALWLDTLQEHGDSKLQEVTAGGGSRATLQWTYIDLTLLTLQLSYKNLMGIFSICCSHKQSENLHRANIVFNIISAFLVVKHAVQTSNNITALNWMQGKTHLEWEKGLRLACEGGNWRA